jgi:hypothetical protein
MMSSFLAGSCPENFWVWHTIKSAILLPWVFFSRRAKKNHYYLMDFCWIMCAYSCLFGVSLFFGQLELRPEFFEKHADLLIKAFYSFYALSTGPIGMNIAIEMRANGMVFHDIERIIPLFIHSSPLVTAWCL